MHRYILFLLISVQKKKKETNKLGCELTHRLISDLEPESWIYSCVKLAVTSNWSPRYSVGIFGGKVLS